MKLRQQEHEAVLYWLICHFSEPDNHIGVRRFINIAEYNFDLCVFYFKTN